MDAIPPVPLVDEAAPVAVVAVELEPPAPLVPVVTTVGTQPDPPPTSNASSPRPRRCVLRAANRLEAAPGDRWETVMRSALMEGSPLLAARRGIFDGLKLVKETLSIMAALLQVIRRAARRGARRAAGAELAGRGLPIVPVGAGDFPVSRLNALLKALSDE